MSHPLLVESIENQFVPGLIYNNQNEDKEKLARFKEPSWNNPVIRFLDADLKDIVSRKDGVWSTHQVVSRMIESLKAAKKTVPATLELVKLQTSSQTEVATFAMHCYWEGEVQFGKIKGVKQTRSAWHDGKEIVNIAFDPTVSTYEEIVKAALQVRCASTIYTRSPLQKKIADSLAEGRVQSIDPEVFGRAAKASDQKYYLQLSPIRLVPMTDTQQVRVNSALGSRSDTARYLSPKQIKMAKWIQKNAERPGWLDELAKAQAKMNLVDYDAFVTQKMK